MSDSPLLSIIIPAYNEEKRLPASLEKISAFLDKQSYTAEVVVVENGSTDRTYEVAADFAKEHEKFKVIQAQGRGKGLAVRTGMLAAQGQYRFMCDADLSMPIEELSKFLPPQIEAPQIVIGSREAPWRGTLRRAGIPPRGRARHQYPDPFAGACQSCTTRNAALKLFRADIAEDLFRAHKILDGWSFDIEVLRIARQRGYEIIELPIPWYYTDESHVQSPSKTPSN